VTVEVFTLANPYRVVVDLPDVAFDLGHDVGRRGRGLVKAFRYGLFAEGKARIVLDVTGPVKIEKAGMVAGADGRRVELAVAIVPMEGASFGSGTGGNRTAAAAPQQGLKSASGPDDAAAAAAGRAGKRRPVVVIDPGHGGIDGGAVGGGRLLEKDVALSVGLELRRWLQATGRYDVRMTRQSDVFISLDRRLRICRDLDADLFISLHADSIEDTAAARNVRGATIYTLSERASDEQARLMAEKENASDLIAGIDVSEGDGDEQVKSILIDLMKRETSNFSAEFSRALVSRLRQAVPLSKDPERSAAFKVLKQTHSPAVLIELGYMTNEHDQKLLGSTDWRSKMARQITSAVDAYFARHAARAKD
jgi:N-acetylmuramoyl-L-alanine amidase